MHCLCFDVLRSLRKFSHLDCLQFSVFLCAWRTVPSINTKSQAWGMSTSKQKVTVYRRGDTHPPPTQFSGIGESFVGKFLGNIYRYHVTCDVSLRWRFTYQPSALYHVEVWWIDSNLSEKHFCLHLQDFIQKFCKIKGPSVVLPKTATMSKLRIRYSRIEVTCNVILMLMSPRKSTNSVFLVYVRS
jgi:hypothetical protein